MTATDDTLMNDADIDTDTGLPLSTAKRRVVFRWHP